MVAIDQYGGNVYIKGDHPRKELMEALQVKSAKKIYVDRAGKTYHIGYCISGRWFTLYAAVEKCEN